MKKAGEMMLLREELDFLRRALLDMKIRQYLNHELPRTISMRCVEFADMPIRYLSIEKDKSRSFYASFVFSENDMQSLYCAMKQEDSLPDGLRVMIEETWIGLLREQFYANTKRVGLSGLHVMPTTRQKMSIPTLCQGALQGIYLRPLGKREQKQGTLPRYFAAVSPENWERVVQTPFLETGGPLAVFQLGNVEFLGRKEVSRHEVLLWEKGSANWDVPESLRASLFDWSGFMWEKRVPVIHGATIFHGNVHFRQNTRRRYLLTEE